MYLMLEVKEFRCYEAKGKRSAVTGSIDSRVSFYYLCWELKPGHLWLELPLSMGSFLTEF